VDNVFLEIQDWCKGWKSKLVRHDILISSRNHAFMDGEFFMSPVRMTHPTSWELGHGWKRGTILVWDGFGLPHVTYVNIL